MKTDSRQINASSRKQNRTWSAPVTSLIAIGLLVIVAAAYWMFAANTPPQVSRDPALLSTIDAVFTAINAQNRDELLRLESKLEQYRLKGTLEKVAYDHILAISNRAKSGDWQVAAEQLYSFIAQQR